MNDWVATLIELDKLINLNDLSLASLCYSPENDGTFSVPIADILTANSIRIIREKRFEELSEVFHSL